MTPEAQNIAIAKAIGRKFHHPTEEELRSGSYYQYEPDFTHDLNACAEMEKVLNARQRDVYAGFLAELTGGAQRDFGAMRINATTAVVSATAAQRCEAFLRTLGLWEE